jgi:hypothetical protein
MIFNGHTHDSLADIDDITMAQIQTMYADGLIGNRGTLEVLGCLTAGVFNYMRQANSRPYKLANILGSAYDYIYPPTSEQDKKAAVNNSLLAFMTQAPDFKQDRFKHG